MQSTFRDTARPCRGRLSLGLLTAAAVAASSGLAWAQIKTEPNLTGQKMQPTIKQGGAQVFGTGMQAPATSLSPTAIAPTPMKANVIYPPQPRVTQDASDSCALAPVVGYGTHPFSLAGATNDYAGTCGATGAAEDVWYDLLAPATESVTVQACGVATNDTVLEVLAACGGPTIVCNDDSCGLQSSVTFDATAGTHYWVRISDFGGCGGCPGIAGSIIIGPPPPPPTCADCPPGGIAENELDCGLPIDTVNGGCNSTPPVFSPIAVGDTVCGTGAFDGSTRDTDWYRVVITANTQLTWTVNAEFEVLVGMVNSPCPQGAFIPGTAFISPACTPVTSTACLCPGEYYMFVAPNFSNPVTCGPSRYVGTLTGIPCEPPPPPSCADCPPGGIDENEPDCGVPIDTVNGGCNSTPPVFSPIALGQTVCGTGAFDGATRDTDWYELTLVSDTEITWTAQAEFDFVIGTISSPCPQGAFRVFATSLACAGPISVTECLRAGTYYLFMAPQFTNVVACGGSCGAPARYTATVTGIPCSPPPPPPNDDCQAATPIGDGTWPYTLTDASNDYFGACGATDSAADVWFLYTASTTGNTDATTCNLATHDSVLEIVAACDFGPTIACNDDACGLQSRVTWATTAGQQYLIRVSDFAGCGGCPGISGSVLVGPPAPPPTCANCPPGGIAENEADCGVPIDTVNGGCNSTPNVFSPISLNQTVCGTGAFDGGTRDTDWWQFTLAGPTQVTWAAQAEFDLLIGFVPQPCPAPGFVVFATSLACAPGGATVTTTLAAGTWVAFVAPQFTNPVTCGPARYVATLTGGALGACCVAGDCTITTQANCQAQNGSYQGDNTVCPEFAYAASTCNDSFEDISVTGTTVPGVDECDDCFANVPLGFSFSFYGSSFSDIYIASNGFLTFGTGNASFGNVAIPNTNPPNNMIAPWWDDLWTNGAGTVKTQTLGAAPNRRFIAQWTNVNQYPGTPDTLTFQAILFEGSNEIDFRYSSIGSPNDLATVGVENAGGTSGTSIDYLTITPPDCRTLTGAPAGPNPCDQCPCDFNNDASLNSQDFFDFLTCFFTPGSCPPGAADYNGDNIVNSQDFFDFLNCFFNPPAGCL